MGAKELRMNAYYYSFDKTGNLAIDRILSAVACAGKAYHHTDDWNNGCLPYEECHRGATPVEWIQNAAIDAAEQNAGLIDALEKIANNDRPTYVGAMQIAKLALAAARGK